MTPKSTTPDTTEDTPYVIDIFTDWEDEDGLQ